MADRILFKLKIKKTSAANAPYISGWRLGKLAIQPGATGTAERYRAGWTIYYERKRLFFIPTSRTRSFLT